MLETLRVSERESWSGRDGRELGQMLRKYSLSGKIDLFGTQSFRRPGGPSLRSQTCSRRVTCFVYIQKSSKVRIVAMWPEVA